MNKILVGFLTFIFCLIITFLAVPVFADSLGINFEQPTYVTGSINGQDGWVSLGAGGIGLDHTVVTQSTYSVLGAQSLRISNAITSANLSMQTYSKPLVDEAGETDALNGGFSGGTRQKHFEAEWDFASADPNNQQAGLSVVASPDRGDGSRMSWIQLFDKPGGIEINFFDYQDVAPFGSLVAPSDGCFGSGDGFIFTNIASGLDRTTTHRVKMTMDLADGPHNDIVNVYVDGILMLTDTSWEDFHRWCGVGGGLSRTVDSMIFVTDGSPVPATLGKGFLIDNLSLSSGSLLVGPPTSKDQCKNDGWKTFNNPSFKNQGQCIEYVEHHLEDHDENDTDHDKDHESDDNHQDNDDNGHDSGNEHNDD